MRCHRRIEKQLITLSKLPGHVAANGVDAQASAAAQSILRFFDKTAHLHHADEDHDLYPLLLAKITDPAELERFRELRGRLETDHSRMESCWIPISHLLRAIAEGLKTPLAPAPVEDFRALYETHIPTEDWAIPDLVKRYLSQADLEALGRSMAARRGVAFPG